MKLFRPVLILSLLVIGGAVFAASPARPNVLFILADDLGWNNTTFNRPNAFYETPNIQRLAQRGLRFTQAYAANPLCSPTRASILSGLYPARIGITAPNSHLPQVILEKANVKNAAPTAKVLVAQSMTRFETSYFTIPKAFKAEGYATGHFGKWHLGPEPYSPLQHGFDVDFPHWPGPGPAGSYVAPWKFPATLNVLPATLKFDGRSFAPALRGAPHDRGPTFVHFPHTTPAAGGIAPTWVRVGDWKLIRFYCQNDDQTDLLELYNLRDDLSETKNLAAQNPAMAAELNALITGFLRDTGAVIPLKNPNYRADAAADPAAKRKPQAKKA